MSNSFSLSFYNKEDAIDQEREGVQCSEVPQKWSVSGSKCLPQSESVCVCLDKQVQKGGRLRQSQARSTLSELFAFVQCSMRGKERRTSEERETGPAQRKEAEKARDILKISRIITSRAILALTRVLSVVAGRSFSFSCVGGGGEIIYLFAFPPPFPGNTGDTLTDWWAPLSPPSSSSVV